MPSPKTKKTKEAKLPVEENVPRAQSRYEFEKIAALSFLFNVKPE